MEKITELFNNNKIIVCDMIAGGGKTSASIDFMRENANQYRFIFITPFLDEIKRIKQACPEMNFTEPSNEGGSKFRDFHMLIRQNKNIASTHAIFKMTNAKTVELLESAGNYILIIDESVNVISQVKIKKNIFNTLEEENIIEVKEDGLVKVVNTDNSHTQYDEAKEIINLAETDCLYIYEGYLIFWMFSKDIFNACVGTIIMTYLFDCQILRYYFDVHEILYSKIGTRYDNELNKYIFTTEPKNPEYTKKLKSLINILDNDKLNSIGNNKYSLSANWYNNATSEKKHQVRKNLKNVLMNIFDAKTDDALWTMYKDKKDFMANGSGFKKAFLHCASRATNEYKDRYNLAYLINRFAHTTFKNYFSTYGIKFDEDGYALSEMVQWIFRSRIRDELPINIYVPSKRMRNLLIDWLDSFHDE